MRTRYCYFVILLCLAAQAGAKDLFVDADHGNDAADGQSAAVDGAHGPVKTIKQGIALAEAGDTVNLAPGSEPYHETIMIRDKGGEPGKPITLDGHGSTVTGCDPLKPEDWQMESPGLYKSSTLFKILKGDDALIQRMFFLFNGKMQLMNRTSKGAKAPWKAPQDLANGEWTYLPDSTTFYIKVDSAKDLGSAGVEIPYRENGLAIRGKGNDHWIVKNVTATHVVNDGYNLHTECSDFQFQNIASYECGDDGFSAHEGCTCSIDGYRASGNSTGFANGFPSDVTLKNAYLFNNHAMEILQMHESKFAIQNVFIVTDCQQPIVIRGVPDKGKICSGTIDNVQIQITGSHSRPALIGAGAVVTITRLTSIGLAWTVEGELHLSQSVLAQGTTRSILDVKSGSKWTAKQNVYSLQSFSFGGNSLGADLAAFQKAAGQDEGSRKESISGDALTGLLNRKPAFAPSGAQLDESKIPLEGPQTPVSK